MLNKLYFEIFGRMWHTYNIPQGIEEWKSIAFATIAAFALRV